MERIEYTIKNTPSPNVSISWDKDNFKIETLLEIIESCNLTNKLKQA